MSTIDHRKYKRLPAPVYLSQFEKHTWNEAVESLPPEHFGAGDTPTLVSYCQTFSLLQRINTELANQPLVVLGGNGQSTSNVLVEKQLNASAKVGQLAKILRLAPISRLATKEKASNPEFQATKMTDNDEIDQLFLNTESDDGRMQ